MEYGEDELIADAVTEDYIFNMVRDARSIRKLQEYERAGRRVVNSAFGIENCTRERMTRLLTAAHVPHPRSIIIPTDADPTDAIAEAGFGLCWIKRGDFHAIHREDVTYTRNADDARAVLEEYAIRGIRTAVVNEHLRGDLVKFYGVAGTDFFHWFYPEAEGHSKFGLEKINGRPTGIAFDVTALQSICHRAAKTLGVVIYGGDCIVAADGTMRIIDFNDWPSFAPCRDEAAPFIASSIHSLLTEPCKTPASVLP
jgi:hypothetical protein